MTGWGVSLRTRILVDEAVSLFTPIASGSRIYLYVTLNLFQGPFFEMLKQVQHDEIGASLRTPYFRLRNGIPYPVATFLFIVETLF